LHFYFLTACSGLKTYPSTAQAGDTVSVAMGFKKSFKRSNTTVTIIQAGRSDIIYSPDDDAIRAIINLYPDPVSWIKVGNESYRWQDSNYGFSYSSSINDLFTEGDSDWWQSMAFIDLPSTLVLGDATIELTNDAGEFASSTFKIIDDLGATGAKEKFEAYGVGQLSRAHLAVLERSPNYSVAFLLNPIPYAIQVEFSHLDTGVAHVVDPRGNMKNIMWNDTGTVLKVIMTPSKNQQIYDASDFKFYVAGGVTGLTPVSIEAFDIDGVLIPGIDITSITLSNY